MARKTRFQDSVPHYGRKRARNAARRGADGREMLAALKRQGVVVGAPVELDG